MFVRNISPVQNGINSCKMVTDHTSPYTSYHYEHDYGKLIYALIKEDSESHTHLLAMNILQEISKNTVEIGLAQ